jgi:DNA processing protein
MFPIRNEIVAALSDGIIIPEAGVKSGTLITAGLALEHGRDVFAIP